MNSKNILLSMKSGSLVYCNKKEYGAIRPTRTGFYIQYTNKSNSYPFVSRQHGNHLFIPRRIIECYDLPKNDNIQVSQINCDLLFIPASKSVTPPKSIPEELLYDKKSVVDFSVQETVEITPSYHYPSLKVNLSGLYNDEQSLCATFHMGDTQWIDIRPMRKTDRFLEYRSLQREFGYNGFQNFFGDTLTCITKLKNGEFLVPLVWIRRVDFQERDKLRILTAKNHRTIVAPTKSICSFDGKEIEPILHAPHKEELCGTCAEHKNEISEFMNLFDEFLKEFQTLVSECNAYKDSLQKEDEKTRQLENQLNQLKSEELSKRQAISNIAKVFGLNF